MTAEISLIWTDVARTNVVWTNVNLIVEICLDIPLSYLQCVINIGTVTAVKNRTGCVEVRLGFLQFHFKTVGLCDLVILVICAGFKLWCFGSFLI